MILYVLLIVTVPEMPDNTQTAFVEPPEVYETKAACMNALTKRTVVLEKDMGLGRVCAPVHSVAK